eukprot:1142226-Pelagomonas_calceolata.AAC.3
MVRCLQDRAWIIILNHEVWKKAYARQIHQGADDTCKECMLKTVVVSYWHISLPGLFLYTNAAHSTCPCLTIAAGGEKNYSAWQSQDLCGSAP